jgi:hypothetical protein
MEVVVRSRGLLADRVVETREGFLRLYRESTESTPNRSNAYTQSLWSALPYS